MASDRSYITLLCDNLATLATVWAEVRRDFLRLLYSLLTRVSDFRLDSRLSILRTNLTVDCR